VIFSFVGGRIVAVSVAKAAASDSPRPQGLGEGLWQSEGRRVEVEYRDPDRPLPIADVVEELRALLPEKYSPLNRFGTGNQGYLFAVPAQAGRFLSDRIDAADDEFIDVVSDAVARAVPDATERRALVLSRVGQGQFRDGLMRLWGGRCAVTGLDVPLLLRASHIKPWRDSDNRERLDPNNGLLLSPAYDVAFDASPIGFAEQGGLLISPGLGPENVRRLGLDGGVVVRDLDPRHLAYLAYHRDRVYRGGTSR
jgi:hypothetical protein